MFGETIEPGQIIIKNPEVLRALMERQYHPLIIQIQCDMAKEHGIVITEAYRDPLRPGDVHAHMQAIDDRYRCYTPQHAKRIAEEINRRWQYDYERPEKVCSKIHEYKKGGIHFHNQVHTNTRRRAI